MIVLAIAGLILAVVFIAVPALQRSQRNGARNNDRSYIRNQYLQAISDNGGRRPTAAQINLRADELNWVGTGGDDSAAAQTALNTNLTTAITPTTTHSATVIDEQDVVYYSPATLPTTNVGVTFSPISPNALLMMTGVRCNVDVAVATQVIILDTNTGARGTSNVTTLGANRNSIAIFYQNEGSNQIFCADDTN